MNCQGRQSNEDVIVRKMSKCFKLNKIDNLIPQIYNITIKIIMFVYELYLKEKSLNFEGKFSRLLRII